MSHFYGAGGYPVQVRPSVSPMEDAIVQQVDWYMGRVNLQNDEYLKAQMDDHLWVSLDIILAFPKMLRMGVTDKYRVAALLYARSNVVEVDESACRIRPAWARRSQLIIYDLAPNVRVDQLAALFHQPSPSSTAPSTPPLDNHTNALPNLLSLQPLSESAWMAIFESPNGASMALASLQDKSINGHKVSAEIYVDAFRNNSSAPPVSAPLPAPATLPLPSQPPQPAYHPRNPPATHPAATPPSTIQMEVHHASAPFAPHAPHAPHAAPPLLSSPLMSAMPLPMPMLHAHASPNGDLHAQFPNAYPNGQPTNPPPYVPHSYATPSLPLARQFVGRLPPGYLVPYPAQPAHFDAAAAVAAAHVAMAPPHPTSPVAMPTQPPLPQPMPAPPARMPHAVHAPVVKHARAAREPDRPEHLAHAATDGAQPARHPANPEHGATAHPLANGHSDEQRRAGDPSDNAPHAHQNNTRMRGGTRHNDRYTNRPTDHNNSAYTRNNGVHAHGNARHNFGHYNNHAPGRHAHSRYNPAHASQRPDSRNLPHTRRGKKNTRGQQQARQHVAGHERPAPEARPRQEREVANGKAEGPARRDVSHKQEVRTPSPRPEPVAAEPDLAHMHFPPLRMKELARDASEREARAEGAPALDSLADGGSTPSPAAGRTCREADVAELEAADVKDGDEGKARADRRASDGNGMSYAAILRSKKPVRRSVGKGEDTDGGGVSDGSGKEEGGCGLVEPGSGTRSDSAENGEAVCAPEPAKNGDSTAASGEEVARNGNVKEVEAVNAGVQKGVDVERTGKEEVATEKSGEKGVEKTKGLADVKEGVDDELVACESVKTKTKGGEGWRRNSVWANKPKSLFQAASSVSSSSSGSGRVSAACENGRKNGSVRSDNASDRESDACMTGAGAKDGLKAGELDTAGGGSGGAAGAASVPNGSGAGGSGTVADSGCGAGAKDGCDEDCADGGKPASSPTGNSHAVVPNGQGNVNVNVKGAWASGGPKHWSKGNGVNIVSEQDGIGTA